MFVKHLQEYLDQFTDGKRGNAISNATIYMQVGGHLEEVKRIEVQESNIIGQKFHSCCTKTYSTKDNYRS